MLVVMVAGEGTRIADQIGTNRASSMNAFLR
jgi:hypothetical protein